MRNPLGCNMGQSAFNEGARIEGQRNVVVKTSGACTPSHEPFLYLDIREILGRCFRGADWTRAVRLLTYEQGVEALRGTDRLAGSGRATLMGGTLARVCKWRARVNSVRN